MDSMAVSNYTSRANIFLGIVIDFGVVIFLLLIWITIIVFKLRDKNSVII